MSQTTFESIPGIKESGWTYKDYETFMYTSFNKATMTTQT